MVQLADEDIRTREVLDWTGVHLLHFRGSSCSAKLRIFLNIKGASWQSHEVDLIANENISAWFLGINPRGLVPVLVDDGAVHIESNDILLYLEKRFPTPSLIPQTSASAIADLLRHEDDLHFDLRRLSFRFVFNPPSNPKPAEVLSDYSRLGAGTVDGREDAGKAEQIQFWANYSEELSDASIRRSVARFGVAFAQLERQLSDQPYLLGNELSLLDIAWFIYVDRLAAAGYPFDRLHPALAAWYAKLLARPDFAAEVTMSPPLATASGSLVEVAGLAA